MKEKELRACAVCAVCGNKIGKTGIPMFWRIRVERHFIKLDAVGRQQGLGMMLGAQLAQVMGPDEEMTQPAMEPVTLTVCEDCCTKEVCIAELAEKDNNGVTSVPALVVTGSDAGKTEAQVAADVYDPSVSDMDYFLSRKRHHDASRMT